MRPHFITDVNKPGNYPYGGWWFAVNGVYNIVTGKFHETKEECLQEIELLGLINL